MDIKNQHIIISEIQQAIGFSIGVIEGVGMMHRLNASGENAMNQSLIKLKNASELLTNLYDEQLNQVDADKI